jgi:carboxymethylenebutenolidase
MLLDQLSPNFAFAQVGKPDDNRINVQSVEYASPNGSGTMRGYLEQPVKAAGKLPAVLVIHENRGAQPAHRGGRRVLRQRPPTSRTSRRSRRRS